MKIAIDIGHAHGTGARGNGYEEHALSSVIGGHLAALLTEAGHKPEIIDFESMSNKADLNATVDRVNCSDHELLISLHCDSAVSTARGAHLCYISSKGKALADCIAAPLCVLMPGRASSTVKRSDLYILRATRPVAVLVECGFISNTADAQVLAKQPQLIAEAISKGILNSIG